MNFVACRPIFNLSVCLSVCLSDLLTIVDISGAGVEYPGGQRQAPGRIRRREGYGDYEQEKLGNN